MIRSIVSLPEEDKRWLGKYSRESHLSTAEIIRQAIRQYRQHIVVGGLKTALKRTAGTWKSVKGDSLQVVDRLRDEWTAGR
jgi:hypothetical protein